jgi:glycosyltransferase involved in cell wall biosynthesis
MRPRLSVVTPTYLRADHLATLLTTFVQQSVRPDEIIIVDGAREFETQTEKLITSVQLTDYPIPLMYRRSTERGTTTQRNIGIDLASGYFIALIDDDIRLDPDFFATILQAFDSDVSGKIGGITGHRQNKARPLSEVPRWRWYKRLGLFKIYESGRFDYLSGYPINQDLIAPFDGTREVDFVTAACTVWRRAVFDAGLRFSTDLPGYAIAEDVHFSMRAGRTWQLLQCGSARCIELNAPEGRSNQRELGYKRAYNYRYLFVSMVPERDYLQEYRFWRVQVIQILYALIRGLLTGNGKLLSHGVGQLHGVIDATQLGRPNNNMSKV